MAESGAEGSTRPEQGMDNAQGPAYSNDNVQRAMDYWLSCVRDWYPDRFHTTYFCPVLHFNRLPYDVITKDDHTILVKQLPDNLGVLPRHIPADISLAGRVYVASWAVQEKKRLVQWSEVAEGESVEYVRNCLSWLARHLRQVMMIMCGLNFKNYLDKTLDKERAAACQVLPRPASVPEQRHRRGDFDLLVIHRQYGLIVGEVKSVGVHTADVEPIHRRVGKAVKQLEKARDVLRYLVSDMAPLRVNSTLILPNITSEQLLRTLQEDPKLAQDLCACFGVKGQNVSAAVRQCLCKDQMPGVDTMQAVLSEPRYNKEGNTLGYPDEPGVPGTYCFLPLVHWWKVITQEQHGPDPSMTDSLYEHLLARFCGQATIVEVPTVTAPRRQLKTRGDAVAETGFHFSILSLYPEQVELLNDHALDSVHLYGPPGTGKTLLVVLKACSWLKQGHDVHVVSVRPESRAVSCLIEGQLMFDLEAEGTSGSDDHHQQRAGPWVHLHTYDFGGCQKDMTKAVNDLASLAVQGNLHVILDEMMDLRCRIQFHDFCEGLKKRVDSLSLWCASLEKLKVKPSWLRERTLTTALRCPPLICREVARCKEIAQHSYILPYSPSQFPDATKGLPIVWLRHKDQGHPQKAAQDCAQCGQAIAQQLRNLRVGVDNLQFRDVFILCQDPREEIRSPDGAVTQQALGLVQGLRAQGVPVTVLSRDASYDQIYDVARAISNRVTVARYSTVAGLERRVVVGVGRAPDDTATTSTITTKSAGATEGDEEKRRDDEQEEDTSRLHAMSRPTGLLIWIDDPSQ